jgi:maleylacetate reductase
MLPAVMRWNAVENGERQKALSAAMGRSDRPAADLVRELIQGLDQPVTLRAVNIKRENFDDIATRAMNYDPVKQNPRKVRGPADVKEILEIAW